MKSLSFIIIFLVGISTAPFLHADPAEEFIKAYILIQSGDACEKRGESIDAIERYSGALKILQEIKLLSPEWNPNIITYRTQYCTNHILKDGGKVDGGNVSPVVLPSTSAEAPINTVPGGSTTPTNPSKTPDTDNISNRINNLEKDLQQAQADLNKAIQEKSDLKNRLNKIEETLKATPVDNERFQALTNENNSLKQALAEVESKLRETPSSSIETALLKGDLLKVQSTLEALQKENEDLKIANASLKKDLEDTRNQLKLMSSGATGMTPETLQTLQKENVLLRSIIDRQFQEDAKRTTARDELTRELNDLRVHAEKIRAQLEIIQPPLTSLSEEERRLLKTPALIPPSNKTGPNQSDETIRSNLDSASSLKLAPPESIPQNQGVKIEEALPIPEIKNP